jgi:hypothetical protein
MVDSTSSLGLIPVHFGPSKLGVGQTKGETMSAKEPEPTSFPNLIGVPKPTMEMNFGLRAHDLHTVSYNSLRTMASHPC